MPLLTLPVIADGALGGRPQPTLGADGLELRPWRPDDATAVETAFADAAIQRWHARTLTADEAREWVSSWASRWTAETAASWAVTEEGRVIGQVGLRRLRLDEGLADISYWMIPAARGRGAAGRALTGLTRWTFETAGMHRLELHHATGNAASCRVAEKAGYVAEGVLRSQALHADGWHDMHVHGRVAGD